MRIQLAVLTATISLAGCVVPTQSQRRAPEHSNPLITPQTANPINVEVIDERPAEERIEDQNHADGFVYTTYNPVLQAKAFGDGMGHNLELGHAIPSYRNLNAKQEAAPHALTFRFRLQHWYAKWPLNLKPETPAVRVEGACETTLTVLAGSQVVHTNHYASEGNALFAALSRMSGADYARYITMNIDQKADSANVGVINAFYTDMQAHWGEIVAAEAALP